MIECEATAKLEIASVVTPELSVPVPNVVLPSLNVTLPLGIPAPGKTAVTVAVRVTI